MTKLDALDLDGNPFVLKLLSSFSAGNEKVVLSNKVNKINRKGYSQSRVLLVTDRGIYNLDKTKCKRRIDMSDVSSIIRSKSSDQFVLNVPAEYDYHYSSPFATDICETITLNYQYSMGTKLVTQFVDEADLSSYVTTKNEAKKILPKVSLADGPNFGGKEATVLAGSSSAQRKQTVMHFSRAVDDHVDLDDFDLLKVLGKGSFGKVMQVKFKRTGEILAMKVLHKDAVVKRNQLEHTKAERNILQSVEHPFLVGLRYAFQNEAKLYMVLDYLNGGELFFHLKQARRFDEPRARFYAAEIALALGHLHSIGIVYRDLKPENILLDSEGHLRLTDFGLAKEDVTDNSSAQTFCGTPEYLAPEILKNMGHGRAVDWWSLGTLLYEMLSGLPPFFDQNINTMYKKILHDELKFPNYFTSGAKDILSKLLCRDQEMRLGSMPADVEDIKCHTFFSSIDWNLLFAKKIKPPFKPKVGGTSDVSNFDTCFTDERAQDSFVDESTLARVKDQKPDFDGFTYVPKSALKK